MRAARTLTGLHGAGLVAIALLLAGCGTTNAPDADPTSDVDSAPVAESHEPEPAADSEDDAEDAPDEAPEPDEPESAPRTQAESCEWDQGTLTGTGTTAPAHQDGDLQDVIVGAWQHTHFDSGAGWEAIMDEDIRYVFPSNDRVLYCQHVPGITDHAEHAATFTWDGERMTFGVGFTVTEWDNDTMVWHNHLDDSVYLLQRRS